MANHRIPTQCKTCDGVIVLRIVIAGGDQRFVFSCPHCGAEVRASFYAEPEGPYLLRCDDLATLDAEPPDGLTYPVATDMPVDLRLIGAIGVGGMVSPFITLIQSLGRDAADELMPRVHAMRALRVALFPTLRRAMGFWAERDFAAVSQTLARLPGGEKLDPDDPLGNLDHALTLLYQPIADDDERLADMEELLKLVRTARDEHPQEFADLMAECTPALEEHRRRVAQVVMGAWADVDAYFPALWAEAMEGKLDLGPYRIMRDDFAERKSGFQDLFELASRTLAFIAPIANLGLRGSIREYADGTTRTPHKARKARAVDREPWLADFPRAAALYGLVARDERNKIGHVLVRYDVSDGTMVYEDESRRNYMLFMVDSLNALRVSRYLIDVNQVFDYVRIAMAAEADEAGNGGGTAVG